MWPKKRTQNMSEQWIHNVLVVLMRVGVQGAAWC